MNVCLSMEEQFSVRRVLASCVVFRETAGCVQLHFYLIMKHLTSSLMYTKLYVCCYFIMEFLSTHADSYVFIYVLSSTDMNVL